jgi:hypothetical protein
MIATIPGLQSAPNFFLNRIFIHYVNHVVVTLGRDSAVGIATRYELDGPGIESRWESGFPLLSIPALGPTQPPMQRVPGLSRG